MSPAFFLGMEKEVVLRKQISMNGIRLFALLTMALSVCFIPDRLAAEDQDGPNASSNGSTAFTYSVSFPKINFSGKINQPVRVGVDLSPYPALPGKFYSILAEPLEIPEGAAVKTHPGNRYIEITGTKTGLYRIRINVNLLEKSSCAGIDLKELATREIRISLDD